VNNRITYFCWNFFPLLTVQGFLFQTYFYIQEDVRMLFWAPTSSNLPLSSQPRVSIIEMFCRSLRTERSSSMPKSLEALMPTLMLLKLKSKPMVFCWGFWFFSSTFFQFSENKSASGLSTRELLKSPNTPKKSIRSSMDYSKLSSKPSIKKDSIRLTKQGREDSELKKKVAR